MRVLRTVSPAYEVLIAPLMSRPDRETLGAVMVTRPLASDFHPVPDVTSSGTRRSVVPAGTPVLPAEGHELLEDVVVGLTAGAVVVDDVLVAGLLVVDGEDVVGAGEVVVVDVGRLVTTV